MQENVASNQRSRSDLFDQEPQRRKPEGLSCREGIGMCDACNHPQFLTIPGAHDRDCAVRVPYLRLERLSAAELRAELPGLARVERERIAEHLAGKCALSAVHDAIRAHRACSDALARFQPRLTSKLCAATVARSWKQHR